MQVLKEKSVVDAAKEDAVKKVDKQIEKEIQADADKVLDNAEVFSGDGDIEQALNRCLRMARLAKKTGDNEWPVLCLRGRGGVGKTGRIKDWCTDNNLKLFSKDAKSLDITDLAGALSADLEQRKAVRLSTGDFDPLDRRDSILFLDEYNRALDEIRGSLLTLMNDHEIPDVNAPDGMKKLTNLLFVVVAMNPANDAYDTVKRLDAAELSRMYKVDVTADNDLTLKNGLWKYNKRLNYAKGKQNETPLEQEIRDVKTTKDLKKITPQVVDELTDGEDLEELTPQEEKTLRGQMSLLNTLLTDKRLKFDSDEEEANSVEIQEGIFNPRSLMKALGLSDGTKEDFLEVFPLQCNPAKLPLVELILQDYQDVDDKANSVFKDGEEEEGSASLFSKKDENNLYDKLMKGLGDL